MLRRDVLLGGGLGMLAGASARAAPAPHRRTSSLGPASGAITLSARGAAVGAGYTWGDGVLRYGGHKYPFSISGLSILDVGFSHVHGRGRVFNLRRLQDFSGVYVAATGEATLGHGVGGQVLRNAAGVEISLDQVTEGVRLQGSADGVRLTLR
jgi:hypothetical protein